MAEATSFSRPATIAVVGLGAMGSRIARRILEAGHRTIVWNRTAAKANALVADGAITAPTPREAARQADMLITMVADPPALEAVANGPIGIVAGAHDGLTVIEMSTVGPEAVLALRKALPAATALLDAPVLGSGAAVESGELTIFVGGPHADVERATPLLSLLGRPIATGPLGTGAAAKLVANMALFGVLGLLGESVALGRALGLSDDAAFEVLGATPLGPQAERRRAAIEAHDFPPRFALSLAHKDARLIIDAAKAAGIDLRLGRAAGAWLADAEAAGFGDADYTAILAQIIDSASGG